MIYEIIAVIIMMIAVCLNATYIDFQGVICSFVAKKTRGIIWKAKAGIKLKITDRKRNNVSLWMRFGFSGFWLKQIKYTAWWKKKEKVLFKMYGCSVKITVEIELLWWRCWWWDLNYDILFCLDFCFFLDFFLFEGTANEQSFWSWINHMKKVFWLILMLKWAYGTTTAAS